MKTPFLRSAHVRVFLLILASLLAVSPLGHAEWITLQIPLTLAGHSFTFWEEGSGGSETLLLEVPADQMGYVLGDYSRRVSGVPILMGGSIGADGLWHPDASTYTTISAFRQGTGMFFLRDEVKGGGPHGAGVGVGRSKSDGAARDSLVDG